MRDSNKLKKKRETRENNERQNSKMHAMHMESFPNLLQPGRRRLDEKVSVTVLQDFELQRQRSLQRRSEILAAV